MSYIKDLWNAACDTPKRTGNLDQDSIRDYFGAGERNFARKTRKLVAL